MPIREDFPLRTTNPYGETKLMIERILSDITVAYPDWSVSVLRYFNPIGAHVSGHIGEDPKGIPNNLLPYITKVAGGKLPCLSVYGNDYNTHDGTGVRDYIHVVDLAKGHLAALKYIEKNNGSQAVNLGTGNGVSVLELVHAFIKESGQDVPYKIVERRPGDIASSYADPTLANTLLHWHAEKNVNDMCRDSWNFQANQK